MIVTDGFFAEPVRWQIVTLPPVVVVGGVVGVVVYPWEVTVARSARLDSAQNHIQGEIATIVPVANRVRVRVGPLTAEITAASAERLGLRPGDVVVASFKASGTRLVPLA